MSRKERGTVLQPAGSGCSEPTPHLQQQQTRRQTVTALCPCMLTYNTACTGAITPRSCLRSLPTHQAALGARRLIFNTAPANDVTAAEPAPFSGHFSHQAAFRV